MVGSRIKAYIDESGMDYGTVAEKAGIKRRIFSAMLNEKRKIKTEEYYLICKALDVPLNQFAGQGEVD